MPGLTILLFVLAAVLLVAAISAIYAHESPQWRYWWRDEGGRPPVYPPPESIREAVGHRPTRAVPDETVGVLESTDPLRQRPSSYASDVFRYTIRRPAAAVRRQMPDLGGFSEVPLRLYDQLGNRFTVHQKVRLN